MVTLTKTVKDLYGRNFKSLKKEIEEDIRKLKDLLCPWVGRINIVKMTTYQKQSADSTQYPSKSCTVLHRHQKRQSLILYVKNKNVR